MNIGPKRWLEAWLDSVSERGYQSAFVTALALDGYQVLHSTSHGVLESGKDVIARKGADTFAYQLKGHPGGRYTGADWQAGLDQINQLVTMPISQSITGSTSTRHHPAVVTNGEVHEAVHAFVGQFNYPSHLRRIGARKLSIYGRGWLLELLTKRAEAIWPASIEAQRTILRMLSATGNAEIDCAEMSAAIREALLWNSKPSGRARRERVLGVFLISSIVLGRWMESGNLFEVIKGMSMTLADAYGYLDKYGASASERRELCDPFVSQIRGYIRTLSDYVCSFGRRPLSEANIFSEFGFYHQRKMLLLSVVSAQALRERFDPTEAPTGALEYLGEKSSLFPCLEGEYIIPAVLCLGWALHDFPKGRPSERWLAVSLAAILHRNKMINVDEQMPSPYYGLPEVTEFKYRMYLGIQIHEMSRETFRFQAWFAYPLFLLLVRRNLKQTAKLLFRDLTHFMHKSTKCSHRNEFGAWRDDHAREESHGVPYPATWGSLVTEATRNRPASFPSGFKEVPDLLAMYCVFFPYRATTDVVLWLDRKFCRTWY